MNAHNHNDEHIVTESEKSAAIKILAILGFVAAIIAGLWITVQVIRLVPSAFSSLASTADSLYGGAKTVSLSTEEDIVNSGDTTRISWKPMRQSGSYTLSYRCVEGISAETRNHDGDIVAMECGKEVEVASGKPVGEQVSEIMFTSAKQRFTDVPFSLAFYKDGSDEVTSDTAGVVTVVNATIPQVIATAPVKPTPAAPAPTKPVATKPVVTPKAPTAPTPVVKPPVTGVKKVPVTTTSYPVSNPNGTTDLEVTIVGVGVMRDGKFVAQSSINADESAVVLFATKNIGTKTSNGWSYTVTFPGNTTTTVTKEQAPLNPGERATTAVAFVAQDETGTEQVKASVAVSGDTKSSNNTAVSSVRIVR